MGENKKCTSCERTYFIRKLVDELKQFSKNDIEELLNILDEKEIIEYIKKKQVLN